MADQVIDIHPTAIQREIIDFTDELPNDTSVTAVATATDSGGQAASIVASVAASGMEVTVKFSGMEDGEDYLVTVVGTGVTTADEAVRVLEIRSRNNQGMF